jgi:phytanoyl-CoA hydroxylase
METVLASIRSRAAQAFSAIQTEVQGTSISWVDKSTYNNAKSDPRRRHFDQHGFLLVKQFASKAEVNNMKTRMTELIKTWEPGQELVAFRTDSKQSEAQGSNAYFLESANKIHFFSEVDAVESTGGLKPGVKKHEALNKVGHGLHVEDSVFREYSTSDKISELVSCLYLQYLACVIFEC